MELKQYQQIALEQLRKYLEALQAARAKSAQAAALGIEYDWGQQAWRTVRGSAPYAPHRNGIGEPLPIVCLKVPTAGGKTLLGVHAVDDINRLYRRSQTGLVLWIVPTTQIYDQTYKAFRDRAHPYRQQLDMASAGRTLILEKDQIFSPEDVQSNLVILLLMLPAANRRDKETLKIFQDRGGFEAFFPPEDQLPAHTVLRENITNLDAYSAIGLMGGAVKSSLGNTLRLLRPVIILDEGHKAYSEIAQETLRSFNPSFILELTATPPPESNQLVKITGQQVLNEGMIKLPINVHTHARVDWREALLTSVAKRDQLEAIAKDYAQREGTFIRPICLIQVERTGEKQRSPRFIHAEDVRDALIIQHNVPPEQIAVKSSERDEIENIDLLDPDCPIRYIITKQALQEGWDCPFAYVLTTLVNSKAPVSMTQLIGRILRQPYARKTGVPALDESYIYFSSPQTGELIQRVYAGLREEGLEDVQGGVHSHKGLADDSAAMVELQLRDRYSDYAGRVYLPCFVVPDDGHFREIGYEMDILSQIKWEQMALEHFDTLQLNPTRTGHTSVRVGLEWTESALEVADAADLPLDLTLMTRQLLDVVPNPWVAYDIAQETVERLRRRYDEEQIRRDLGFIITRLKKILTDGRDEQARQIFVKLLETGQLKFWLITGCVGNAIPDRIRAHAGRKLRHPDTDELPMRSLFDYAADEFNKEEAAVALYLDQQNWVLGWLRNFVPRGYSIQGWQPHRVYPDLVALQGKPKLETVHVLEVKGLYLDNANTDYKQQLFDLCNQYSRPMPWDEIAKQFANYKMNFQVVFEDEWRRVINALFSVAGEN